MTPVRVLRAEMSRRCVTYKHLARLLTQDGYKTDPDNLKNRICRNRMSAAFWLRCLSVMGCDRIPLT